MQHRQSDNEEKGCDFPKLNKDEAIFVIDLKNVQIVNLVVLPYLKAKSTSKRNKHKIDHYSKDVACLKQLIKLKLLGSLWITERPNDQKDRHKDATSKKEASLGQFEWIDGRLLLQQ